MFNVTKKARKSLSVAAAASLAAGMLVGAVAPASAAGVDGLVVAKGLAIDTNYNWDSGGPALIAWNYSDDLTWELISVPAGSEMDEGDFASTSVGNTEYLGLDNDNSYTTETTEDYNRGTDSYLCDDSDLDTTYDDICFNNRADLQEFDVPGEYKFEVRGDNKVSIVTIVVGNLNVVRVELSVDHNVVAPEGMVYFNVKSYDDAGRLTYAYNYDFYDTLQEFVLDYEWNLSSDDFTAEYFNFDIGAQRIGFTIDDELDWDFNTNYTFEAQVDGIQSNVVTVRVVESADNDGESLSVVEVPGKVVQLVNPEWFEGSYAGVIKSQRAVTFTYDSGSADNAGLYVYLHVVGEEGIDNGDLTVSTGNDKWIKLDAEGKLSITVTNNETIIDSWDSYSVYVSTDNDVDADIQVDYMGAGETAEVRLVNIADFYDYNEPTYPVADYDAEYYKTVLPGQSVDVKVKVTDIFGNVLPNHPVYAEYEEEYEANINWSEDADFAEFADEVETDANGFATFTLKNSETSAMTQIELWKGFRIITFGNDINNAFFEQYWEDSIELYFQVVRSTTVDSLNALVSTEEGGRDSEWLTPAEWAEEDVTMYIDDLDDAEGSYHYDNVAISYQITNSDNVALWGVPVTYTATGAWTSDGDEHDLEGMSKDSLVLPSSGDLDGGATAEDNDNDWANFTTNKAGATSFSISAGGLTATAVQDYAIEGDHVARYVTAVDAVVNVTDNGIVVNNAFPMSVPSESTGGVVTLSYKVTDRFGNVVPGVTLAYSYGSGNAVLGGWGSQLTASSTTNDAGIAVVDVWTASGILDQKITSVKATINDDVDSAASEGCAANYVYWGEENEYDVDIHGDGPGCYILDETTTITAAVGSATTAINYNAPAVAADVKALKNAFSVSVDNAKGKVVRVYVGSFLKGMFVAKTDAAIRRYKAKAGSKVVTVKVEDYSRAETIKVRK